MGARGERRFPSARGALTARPMFSALILPVAVLSHQAQDEQQPRRVPPADIIVTAPTLPDPRSDTAYGEITLDPRAVDFAPRQSLEAILPLIPGAQQFRRSDSRSSNPTAQGLTLRALGGNAAARTLVLRDGVPVADPFFGSVPFNSILLGSTRRISITPGAGAGPFGGGSIAGAVEIFSADPLNNVESAASLSFSSFDTITGSLGLGTQLGQGGVRLAVAGERSDGSWTTPAASRVAASVPASYRHWAAELAGAVQAGQGRLDVRLGLFDDMRTLRFAGADSRSQGADVSARWVRTGHGDWDVELVGWVQLRDFAATTISATTFRPVLDQRATPSTGWGGKIELRPSLSGQRTLRLGVDVRSAEGRTDEVALNASGAITLRRRAGGRSLLAEAYLEQDVRAGPLVLGAGVRVDRWWLSAGHLSESNAVGSVVTDQSFVDRALTRWTARSAVSLDLGAGFVARASAYRGFRVPTLNELYRPFVLFPVTTRANANLAPERLTGVEAGLVYAQGNGMGFSLTAFANRVEGAIANVSIGPNLRQRANLSAIRARGLEFSGHYGFGLHGRLQITAAWTDARVEGGSIAPGLDGLRPAQAPRFSGAAALLFGGPAATVNAITLRHGGQQFEDDLNSDSLPAFTTIDASTSWPIDDHIGLILAVENVIGTRIVTRNSGGSTDLGSPRAIRLTLRVN